MSDIIASFVYKVYSGIWQTLDNYIGEYFEFPSFGEPIVAVTLCIAYLVCVVLIVKLIIGVIRWFYRI